MTPETLRTTAATIRPFSEVKSTTVISERQGDALCVELETDGVGPNLLRFLAERGLGIKDIDRREHCTVVKCSMV